MEHSKNKNRAYWRYGHHFPFVTLLGPGPDYARGALEMAHHKTP